MSDEVKEECGVFSAQDFNNGQVFPYIYWGLRAQNHRGHQSHGIITYNGNFHVYKGLDLVPKIKRRDFPGWLDRLPGSVGIGNIRYTTSDGTDDEALTRGTQPVFLEADG